MLFFLLLSSFSVVLSRLYTINEASEIIKTFDLKKYSKHIAPPTKDGGPFIVDVYITFFSLSPLAPRYYEMDMELILGYQDPRLKFNSSNENMLLKLVDKSANEIWSPDIWVQDENAGQLFYHDIQVAEVESSGYVYHSRKLRLQMFCAMNYFVFPFDHQKCEMTFQSFAYNTEQMRLRWPTEYYEMENIIYFAEDFSSKGYTITSKNIGNTTVNYGITGDFDRLVVTFHLERDAVYFMAQHFLPLNLNIILSMTTFWIDYKCVKARVTIPLVVVLTLTKQTMALKAVLPFSSEPVSLEYYLNFSIFFVFMVLLEYCMVELSKIKEIRERLFNEQKERHHSTVTFVGDTSHVQTDQSERTSYSFHDGGKDDEHCIEHPLDRKARVFYPIFFISYNILYFVLLIVNQKHR